MSELKVNKVTPATGTQVELEATTVLVDGTLVVPTVNNPTGVAVQHNGSTKIATTSSGVTVTGTVAATAFSGDGSALTGITSTGTGGTSAAGIIQIISDSDNSDGANEDIVFLTGTSNERGRIYRSTGDVRFNTDTLCVDAGNSRVGIEKTNPDYTLDVNGTVGASSAVVSGNLTVDTDVLHVDSGNNRVGIGTTIPAQALDVVGSINLTGNITGSTVGALASSLLPSGCVLQVIYGQTQTQVNLTSTSYTSTTLTAKITPKRDNSVILVFASQHLYAGAPSAGAQRINWKIVRTVAATSADIGVHNYVPYVAAGSSTVQSIGNQCGVLRDTARPASTAEHTYTVFAAPSTAHGGTYYAVANYGSTSSMVIVEVAA